MEVPGKPFSARMTGRDAQVITLLRVGPTDSRSRLYPDSGSDHVQAGRMQSRGRNMTRHLTRIAISASLVLLLALSLILTGCGGSGDEVETTDVTSSTPARGFPSPNTCLRKSGEVRPLLRPYPHFLHPNPLQRPHIDRKRLSQTRHPAKLSPFPAPRLLGRAKSQR